MNLNQLLEFILNFLSPTRKKLIELRAMWSKVGDKSPVLLERYLNLTGTSSSAKFVDDTSWVNLEFPKIFSILDTTITAVGSQYLYKKLHSYIDNPEELKEQYRCYNELRTNQSLREEIQLKLAYLGDESAGVAGCILGTPPKQPKYYKIITTWALFLIALPFIVISFGLPIPFWICPVILNAILFLFLPSWEYSIETLRCCHRVTRIAESLATIKTDEPGVKKIIDRIIEDTRNRNKVKKSLVGYSFSRESMIIGSISVWLNIVCLIEQLIYIFTVNRFVKNRQHLKTSFELIGELDAAHAIASFLEQYPEHCQPSLSQSAIFDAQNAYHPLLINPVKNPIQLNKQSMLITGSNMAGKTTYIKTVGANIIFGRTLGFCFATSAVIPNSSVMAAIRSEHSIESGKSQYFAEIESILAFIESAEKNECKVFLIDELFSGTNTIERIAAARAVLECLSTNSQVFVTTHDVELQSLMGDKFTLHHFQEDPAVAGFFDYRLQQGAATKRNAIRLMERRGFPADVVRKAMIYAGEKR